jgi:hypothetical protein
MLTEHKNSESSGGEKTYPSTKSKISSYSLGEGRKVFWTQKEHVSNGKLHKIDSIAFIFPENRPSESGALR